MYMYIYTCMYMYVWVVVGLLAASLTSAADVHWPCAHLSQPLQEHALLHGQGD